LSAFLVVAFMTASTFEELARENIVGACQGQETTFSGLDVPNGSSFRVCAYGPESELERATISAS
jgi:hypothetical protein